MNQNGRNPQNKNAYKSKDGAKKKLFLAILTTFVALLVVVAIVVFSEIGMAIAKISNNKDNKNDKEPPKEETPDDDDKDNGIEYKNVSYESAKVNLGELVLVNTSHKYDITSAVTDALVKIYDYRESNTPNGSSYYQLANAQYLKLNSTAMESFHLMVKAFVEKYGDNSLMVTSAFRTLEDQAGKATPPGYSEAHTGYIMALSIYKNGVNTTLTPADPVFSWFYDHAYEYGFVSRYPDAKAAITGVSNYIECFRYVGKLNAYAMKQNNFCLEEYIDHLKNYTFEGEHFEVTDASGSKYEMYFVPTSNGELTTIPVPTANDYTISGTNAGGFVVTVKLS